MVMRMLGIMLAGCLIACSLQPAEVGRAADAENAKPLRHAHAHNDYLHERPLLDALDHGFCSVEADIYLVDGQLLVAHEAREIRPERTLEKLYLEPLKSRIAANQGRVTPDGPAFGLLIDIKSDAESTYLALHQLLARYAPMLTTVDGGQVRPGAVNIVISGERPQKLIASQATRYCGIDGRSTDLDSDAPAHLLPMISDNWTKLFRWRGVGEMPEPEAQRLRKMVEQAHAKGRSVRFWATPDNPAMWQALLNADVDLINTDDLAGLEKFLRSQPQSSKTGN